ncbi:IucA/IucC family protein [Paenibacillus sp. y28]
MTAAASGAQINDGVEAIRSSAYKKVEGRMIRQLVEALLYEQLVPCERIVAAAPGEEDQAVLRGLEAGGEGAAYVCFYRQKQSFGRIRLSRSRPVERVGADGTRSEARLADFVIEVLGGVVQPERLRQFMEELGQTLLKDTQAHHANPYEELTGEQRHYDELEGNILDGHPYHPCYKSRIGFNLEDNAAFGPEFKPELKLLWLAVAKEESEQASSASLVYDEFLQAELGAKVWEGFAAKLAAAGRQPDDYRFIPVHPWQWRETLIRVFHRQLAEGRMVVLGEGTDVYRPQQSIRTLANSSRKERSYVKLPMNLINTSTGRMLAKHTVLNAPIISDWLSTLVQQDEDALRPDFILLREEAGAAYNHECLPEQLRSTAYGTLGVIWRESLHRYLLEGEEAVPFNGLCHVQRSGRPLIDPWIREQGVESWTEQLLQAAVDPLIHLLFAHGVALESHAQNMILIHRGGIPVRTAFKDFHDGVRFSRGHLAKPEHCPQLHALSEHHARVNPNSFIETDAAAVVRDFVHDAFFFINLTELCLFLEEHYGLPEQQFWRMTAGRIHEYRRQHPQHEARFRAFDLFAETIQVEQLTARRLFGDTEVRLQDAPNPLYPFREASC